MRRNLLFAAGAAVLVIFLDPRQGRRRRALLRDRIAAFFRRTGRQTSRRARWARSRVYGMSRRAASLAREEQPPGDDVTLARKVETIIFRDPEVPRGRSSSTR